MARDDAYAERDAAPRSPHVPAPPRRWSRRRRARVAAAGGAPRSGNPSGEAIGAGPLAADAVPRRRGRFAPRTVASPLVTTSATASGPAEDRKLSKLSANDNPTKRPGKGGEKKRLDPTRLSRAHAAVRAAAAAVDAALAGDARVDADADADAVPENPKTLTRRPGDPSPSEDERTRSSLRRRHRAKTRDPTRRANREAFGLKRHRRSSIPRGASA